MFLEKDWKEKYLKSLKNLEKTRQKSNYSLEIFAGKTLDPKNICYQIFASFWFSFLYILGIQSFSYQITVVLCKKKSHSNSHKLYIWIIFGIIEIKSKVLWY